MHISSHIHAPAKRQRGATLIESLVSLIILAIAIIGMLGVQARTLMDTNTAAGRTQAMLLIDDLSERVKANPDSYAALANYVFDDTRAAGSTDCTGSACNAAALAAYDLDRWQENFQATMPGAKVQTFISSDNDATTTGNRQLGVLIGWTLREKNTDASSDYLRNFIVPTANVNSGVACWSGYICHLAYIEP
ncbi:MAG: type IV pilus modification protein PilV [Ottowia sp.]|uniref:type IV pilus modification protein PilV n=1 Tax=Ottowia sp. TaxID=1898956 RepID=UPI0039E5440B